MHHLIAKYERIFDICKQFAGNRVNNQGNTIRCGVVPKFFDLEFIALSFTAEACGINSENLLFKRPNESQEKIPNLISRRQFNARRKRTAVLAEKIRKDIAIHIDGGENVFFIDSKPIRVCQNARTNRCKMGKGESSGSSSERLLRLSEYDLLRI